MSMVVVVVEMTMHIILPAAASRGVKIPWMNNRRAWKSVRRKKGKVDWMMVVRFCKSNPNFLHTFTHYNTRG